MASSSIKQTFSLKLGSEENHLTINASLDIPYSGCPKELACRILILHNIPFCYKKELSDGLASFIKEKNSFFVRDRGRKYIEQVKNGKITSSQLASLYQQKYLQKVKMEEPKGSDISSTYHSVVHSANAEHVLSFEHLCATATNNLVTKKDAALEELKKRQTSEMQEMVSNVGFGASDEDVNNLAIKQLEDLQLLEAQWDSTVSALKEKQQKDFSDLIKTAFECKDLTPFLPKINIENPSDGGVENITSNQEESFTIHLGMQMKQMYNLRLLSADVIELLRYKQLSTSGVPPQRIQTSMSLYSSNLNGLVLLVDDRISTYSGIRKEFGRVCSRSTEFHFGDLEDQLEQIRNLVPDVVKHRKERFSQQNDLEGNLQKEVGGQSLKSGDFYITRHSNLAEVHVVFHLIVDDKVIPDMSSRHSSILGLRNILKVACLGDVTTLTVPLLLSHTLSEEMTIAWCQRRAELVYKCIKGFMIEMASWGGNEMKNIQFLVPKGISEDLFQSLASMLQSIFRLSNPLVVKSS